MASGVSGSYEFDGSKAGIVGRVSYSETYDTASNKSSVTVRVQFKAVTGGWYGFTYYLTGGVDVAGSQVVSCSSTTGLDKVRWESMNTYAYMQAGESASTSWKKTGIAHNADGSKSINITVDLKGYTTDGQHGSGWTAYDSRTIKLTTIPRASEISATSANIGAVSTVVVARKSSSYSHSIAYQFGGLSGYLTAAGGVSTAAQIFANTSVAFTVPAAFYGQIPNAKSGVCTLTCRTYSGSAQIGSAKTCSFTVTAAQAACTPSVSGTVTDQNEQTQALTGDGNVLVRYFSNALCTIAATARNSASITSRTIAGAAVSGSTRSIPNVETGSFLFSATDSRGYAASVTVTKPVVAYVRLTCDGTVSRPAPTASTATLALSGNYFNASFGAADNTLEAAYSVNGGESIPMTVAKSGNTWSASAALSGIPYTETRTITVTAADKLMRVTKTITLNRGVPVFDWGQSSFRVNVPILGAGSSTAAPQLGTATVGSASTPVYLNGGRLTAGSPMPTALRNPAALTFTGGTSTTYDGSAARSVKIPMVAYGSASVATKANTTITQHVNFPFTFPGAPSVVTTLSTTVPQNVSIGVTSVSATGFDAVLRRTTNSDTWFYWIAVW